MAKVSDFKPTLEEYLAQNGSKRTLMYGKNKSKLPKELPKVKSIPYTQPDVWNADTGITRERFPTIHPEFKGYSPELEAALNNYGNSKPLQSLATREAGISIPEATPYIQPKAFNPSASIVNYGIQTSPQLPKIQGVTAIKPNSFGTGVMDSLKGYGSDIANSKIGKFVSNEAGILGETLNNPYVKGLAKVGGEGLLPAQAAYEIMNQEANLPWVQQQRELQDPNSDMYMGTSYNPPSIPNGKLITGTSMEGYSPQLKSQVANAFDGVAQMNLDNQQLQNINNPFSTQALKQLQQQEIGKKVFTNTQVDQPKTNILGEQIPIDQLPKGVGYVNGKLFDSNKQSTQGMFNGYSKERDAALDSYGKVDKNSEFYKRNKKAMENLQ